MDDNTCGNCTFFEKVINKMRLTSKEGKCRRYPPIPTSVLIGVVQPTQQPQFATLVNYPQVQQDDMGCGEHSQRRIIQTLIKEKRDGEKEDSQKESSILVTNKDTRRDSNQGTD